MPTPALIRPRMAYGSSPSQAMTGGRPSGSVVLVVALLASGLFAAGRGPAGRPAPEVAAN